jgi:hypothetical protein
MENKRKVHCCSSAILLDCEEYICVECLLSNRHQGREMVSIDKACKLKMEKYRDLMDQAEQAVSEVQSYHSALQECLDEINTRHEAIARCFEEHYEEVLRFVQEQKTATSRKLTSEFDEIKANFVFSMNEISKMEEAVMSPIQFTSMPFHVLSECLQERENILKILKSKLASRPIFDSPPISSLLSDSTEELMSQIKTLATKCCEKSLIQTASSTFDRSKTPTRMQQTNRKYSSRQQTEATSSSFILNPIPSQREKLLTPRIPRDQSKKSITRSKSPIFRTDIRRYL